MPVVLCLPYFRAIPIVTNGWVAFCGPSHSLGHSSARGCLHSFYRLGSLDETAANTGLPVSPRHIYATSYGYISAITSFTVTVLVNFLRNLHTTSHGDHFASPRKCVNSTFSPFITTLLLCLLITCMLTAAMDSPEEATLSPGEERC